MDLVTESPRDEWRCAGVFGNEGCQNTSLWLHAVTSIRDRQRQDFWIWCIAFAASDPYKGLPANSPLDEKYTAFKMLLKKDGPPRWYQYSWWTMPMTCRVVARTKLRNKTLCANYTLRIRGILGRAGTQYAILSVLLMIYRQCWPFLGRQTGVGSSPRPEETFSCRTVCSLSWT
jgi:hypothetical protein